MKPSLAKKHRDIFYYFRTTASASMKKTLKKRTAEALAKKNALAV